MKYLVFGLLVFISNFVAGQLTWTVSQFSGISSGYQDGTGNLAKFEYPQGVTIDSYGNLYVADSGNQRIRKITSSGVVTTVAGSTIGYQEGTGTAAQFYGPQGVTIDSSGNLYVADSGNQRIRKITSSGVVTTFAGDGTEGNFDATGTAAQFHYPRGVTIDSSGNLYVADFFNHKIRKITPAGVVTTFAGDGTEGNSDGTGTAAQFYGPRGVTIDSSGNLYVADSLNQRIRKITPSGVVTTVAGSSYGFLDGTGTAAQFYSPSGITIDSAGNLYVADVFNHRIRKITPAGVVTTVAGNGTEGNSDGTGTAAQFNFPQGITIDSSGNLYVADTLNHIIRKITPICPSGQVYSSRSASCLLTGTATNSPRPNDSLKLLSIFLCLSLL